ncbi:hypothetical protein [Aeromicrobium sp. UC242_57]|uniref:hypothetical protein n=1 Tax=Aeromicrobium sp. UC242_57 TaxID=3374624 RepID=UPI0037BC7807
MRSKLGWAMSVLGVLIALLGAAVMVVLGPDSRFSTGPHAIETDDVAVVTAPKVISWANVRLDVRAEVPARKPIFIGLANSVDVTDFVARTQRLEVTASGVPGSSRLARSTASPACPAPRRHSTGGSRARRALAARASASSCPTRRSPWRSSRSGRRTCRV